MTLRVQAGHAASAPDTKEAGQEVQQAVSSRVLIRRIAMKKRHLQVILKNVFLNTNLC